MKTKALCIAFLSWCLAGCSSSPASLTYYVLHSPIHDTVKKSDNATRIQLQQLTLPEYLKQRSLAMQTSETTVYFSPRHVWAEPLDKSLRQSLTAALLSHGVEVIPGAMYSSEYPALALHIKIDDFIPTFDGKVLIKGQYWLDGEKSRQHVEYFDFRRPMGDDGFTAAVETMRLLVDDLAKSISQKVQ